MAALGGLPATSLTQRLAHAVAHLTSLSAADAIEAYAAPPGEPVYQVRARVGPLADAMRGFSAPQLDAMAAWVQAGTSSHFPAGSDIPPTHGFLADAGIRALCLNPLVASGEHVGMLVVADRGELPHDPAVVEVLELLAAQSATAWTTAMTITGLRRRADLDPLTGLSNQGAFHRDLPNRLRARRASDQLCACRMIDVDGFKQVNDRHGHLVGDDVLRELAVALRSALRDGDTLYRVGGDELAALIDVRDSNAACSVADRLLAAARATTTTVSIGIALATAGDEPRALVTRADEALYAAKRAGRDTAQLAGHDAP